MHNENMNDEKKPIKYRFLNYSKYFIKEIIPVTMGVLIALAIGNWNQDNKEQKYVSEMFVLIDNELNVTNSSIEEVIPMQESLIDTLQHYSNNIDVNIMQNIIKIGGVNIASIKTNAWNAISNSKLELIDYKIITLLSDISEEKEILKIKSNTIVNFVNVNLNASDKEKKEILILYLRDIIGTENSIQENIKKFQKLRE